MPILNKFTMHSFSFRSPSHHLACRLWEESELAGSVPKIAITPKHPQAFPAFPFRLFLFPLVIQPHKTISISRIPHISKDSRPLMRMLIQAQVQLRFRRWPQSLALAELWAPPGRPQVPPMRLQARAVVPRLP